MRFDDKAELKIVTTTEDERFNVVETSSYTYIGKCKKIPNNSASLRDGEDGKSYYYSMTIFLRNPSIRPKEGDIVKIYDNTAKETFEARVDGVSVLPKKYVRIYVTELKDYVEEEDASEDEDETEDESENDET